MTTVPARTRALQAATDAAYAIPANSADEPNAWRSRHERRVKAAIAAARQRHRHAAPDR